MFLQDNLLIGSFNVLLAMQVVELLVNKVENEPEVHERVNVLLLVNLILQRSRPLKGNFDWLCFEFCNLLVLLEIKESIKASFDFYSLFL